LSLLKRATAPISIGLLIIVAAIAPFTILRTPPVTTPPILDPNFELWLGNSSDRHLVVWRSEYVVATGDSISLNETTFNQMTALKFNLFKENRTAPTYAYVSQEINGPRLAALFALNISAWILREPCACNSTSTIGNGEVFGVELNDGTHVLTFIFSARPAEAQVLWAKRIVFLETPADQWAKVPLDIAEEYQSAQWKKPDRVTLGIIFGAGIDVTGSRQAFLHNFTWTNRANSQKINSAMSISNQSTHGTELQLLFVAQTQFALRLSGTGVKI